MCIYAGLAEDHRSVPSTVHLHNDILRGMSVAESASLRLT